MSSIQWQDEEQSLPAPKHPLWDYNDNVLGSLCSPCLDLSASPQHNSILQLCIHLFGNKQFQLDTLWCSTVTSMFLMVVISIWLHVVRERRTGVNAALLTLCGWRVAQHLMLGSCYQEKLCCGMKICLFHTQIPWKILTFPHWTFSMLFLRKRVTEDASASFSSCCCMMASRCLPHTSPQWARVPVLIQVGYCL